MDAGPPHGNFIENGDDNIPPVLRLISAGDTLVELGIWVFTWCLGEWSLFRGYAPRSVYSELDGPGLSPSEVTP